MPHNPIIDKKKNKTANCPEITSKVIGIFLRLVFILLLGSISMDLQQREMG